MSTSESTQKRNLQLPLILLVALVAGGGVFLWQRAQPKPVTPPPAAVAAAPAPAPAAAAPVTAPVSAATEKTLLDAVSVNALLRSCFAQGDLLHRWAVIADNLAEGVSPRRQLLFLAPTEPFAALEGSTADIIAPGSYARYDAITDAIGSIDADAFARLVRALHPALEAAYHALGYPNASLDSVAAKALLRVEQAPVATRPVMVDKVGQHWEFENKAYEALPPVEKHLLRFGPRNTKIVQAKALELRCALGLAGPAQVVRGAAK